ncbi:MAG: hypothetical protein KTR35_19510 [Gammaproteobacteria bacterium]|nr:hypothetical protein [Gammaproteobacteria bacterium]
MSVTLHHGVFDSPMRFKFKHASAQRSATQNVIVRLTDENRTTGYGEGCPRAYVTGETASTVATFMREYGSTIVNKASDLQHLKHWINSNAKLIDSNPAAFAAIEIAIIDLMAKRNQMSAEALLNLPKLSENVPFTAVIGDCSVSKMRLITTAYRLYGFNDFKVKLSGDLSKDQDRLSAIPKIYRVRVDANNLWPTPDLCIDYFRQLHCAIWAIEEPVKAFDYPAMMKIANALDTKIIVDESLYTTNHLHLLKNPERFVANIRVSKCGGILRSIELANQCIQSNCDVILGAHVGETSLLTRAALVVGQGLKAPSIAREGAYGKILLKRDITSKDIKFSRGGILRPANYRLASKSGLGLLVNPDEISWAERTTY